MTRRPSSATGKAATPGGPLDRADEARSRLAELRRSVVRRARSLGDDFDAMVAAASDVAVDDEHDPEGHTIAWERQQVAALAAEARQALADIDAAERRLDQGSYGICTGCGRAISTQRLDALPSTATCVDCAQKITRHPA